MLTDCITFAWSCKTHQLHARLKHLPPEPLHPVSPYWPFRMLGLDFITPICPSSSKGPKFILIAIEYFTKWAEVVAVCRQTCDCVAQFIKGYIICCFDVPQKIITGNRTLFLGWQTMKLIEKYKIRKVESSPYNPRSKEQVESFNKIFKQILKKIVDKNQRDWHEHLSKVLWSYQTSMRLSTGVSPFMLVYSTEVVLPVEIELSSACLLAATQLDPLHNRYAIECIIALERIDEYQHNTSKCLRHYLKKMAHYYNKCGSLL